MDLKKEIFKLFIESAELQYIADNPELSEGESQRIRDKADILLKIWALLDAAKVTIPAKRYIEINKEYDERNKFGIVIKCQSFPASEILCCAD